MFRFIFLSLVVLLCGCASIPYFQSSITPKSTYKIEQATFTSPDEKNWYLMQNEIHLLVLGKKFDDQSQTAILSATMYPVKVNKNSKAFLEFVADERAKNHDKKRFKILSAKNEFVTFKDLPCLKYQTLSEDHKDKGLESADFEYFKTFGYVCRYPLEYIGFQFEVSHRSKGKEIPKELLNTAESFFQNIQLVEGTIKRLKTIK